MKKIISLILICFAFSAFGQDKFRIFVGEFKGNDPATGERFKKLVIEQLPKIKCFELVKTQEQAQYILIGEAKVDIHDPRTSAFSPSSAMPYSVALIDLILTEQSTGKIIFKDGTIHSGGDTDYSAQPVVTLVMRKLKKQIKCP